MYKISKLFKSTFFISSILLLSSTVAQAAVQKQVDDWTLMCSESEKTKKAERCMMTQTIIDEKNNDAQLLGVAIGYFPNQRHPSISFNLPPQIKASDKGMLVIDDKKAHAFEIGKCDAQKCSAVNKLSADVLRQLRNAKKASVLLTLADDKEINVHFSLKGFNNAYNEVSVSNKANLDNKSQPSSPETAKPAAE